MIEEDDKVYKHAFHHLETAEYYLKFGLRALIKKTLPKDIKYLCKNLRNIEKLALFYACIGSKDDLIEAIINRVIDETFLYEKKLIRSQDRFLAIVEQGKSSLLINAESTCALIEKILQLYSQVLSRLSEIRKEIYEYAVDDIEQQLDYMIFNGFIDDVPAIYLSQYPRYLDSVLKRIEKLEFSQEKDRNNTLLIAVHWNRIRKLVDNAYETEGFSSLLMEQLRISLFTQELKTRVPVSMKRMDKIWEALQKAD